MEYTTFCGGRVAQIATQNFGDSRGVLCPIEFPVFGFLPVRAFLVNGAAGAVRGGHGHRNARQLLMLVSGKIEVEFRLAGAREIVNLDSENRFLFIQAKIWAQQTYQEENSSLMVFSDRLFAPDEYFQDPDEFMPDSIERLQF